MADEPSIVADTVGPTDAYADALDEYCRTRGEAALYRASVLSQSLVESGLGPEDIVALHCEALDRVQLGRSPREQILATTDSNQFLLEVMIAYGVKYREYLELRLSDVVREAETRATRERERIQEAERIGREKDEILAVIAHELRTPLTAARGSVDLVVRSISRGQMERVTTLLGHTREALDRLSRLTGDLVEASRGRPPTLESKPQMLERVLAQACAWAQPAALAKGVDLRTELGAPDVRVLGSADALLSVFGNILSNAIRYTPTGGSVVVRSFVESESVCIEIADTGIGMTEPVISRIFDKFYRSQEARAVESQGLGLGLSLVRQFVLAHSGYIEVESEPGAGTKFRVLLPRFTADKEDTGGDR
jgi:signal transduction histidine kinase